MIIDSHNHISEHGVPAETLIRHMDHSFMPGASKLRVDYSMSQGEMAQNPTQQFDYAKQHEYLLGAIKKYPDRLVGMMVINPWYEVPSALKVLDRLVNEGVRSVKLHPKLHNFRPDDDIKLLGPILEKAARMKLPVHIHTGDPFCEPGRIEYVAERYPDTIIVMCHMASQMVTYTTDAVGVCKRREKVYLETGFHEKRLKEAVKALGAEKVIFASDCPINDIWTGVTMVKALELGYPIGIGLSEEDTGKILGENARKMLGLQVSR